MDEMITLSKMLTFQQRRHFVPEAHSCNTALIMCSLVSAHSIKCEWHEIMQRPGSNILLSPSKRLLRCVIHMSCWVVMCNMKPESSVIQAKLPVCCLDLTEQTDSAWSRPHRGSLMTVVVVGGDQVYNKPPQEQKATVYMPCNLSL